MNRAFLGGLAAFTVLILASGAGAITYGVPDGNGHPEVGALLAQQAFSDGTWEECSGTLIAPKVFLTAAHCDEGVSRVGAVISTSRNLGVGKRTWYSSVRASNPQERR